MGEASPPGGVPPQAPPAQVACRPSSPPVHTPYLLTSSARPSNQAKNAGTLVSFIHRANQKSSPQAIDPSTIAMTVMDAVADMERVQPCSYDSVVPASQRKTGTPFGMLSDAMTWEKDGSRLWHSKNPHPGPLMRGALQSPSQVNFSPSF